MTAGIFATDSLEPSAKKVLAGFDLFEETAGYDTLARCQVLMIWPSRAKQELLLKMRSLRMIQSLAAGVDGLDFSCVPSHVEIFSNAGAYTDSVAEHAWGLALGVSKGVHAGQKRLPPRHLRSKTLLVLGCGSIGSEVARLARVSLSMTTIGVSRSFRSPELFDERHPLVDLPRVIGRADLIVDALPLTVSTRSVIDYSILTRARQTAILVNIGRGGTVDEDSVIRWLKERPDSRYATDVFWKRNGKEVFDSEIWRLPNFGGTIHTAAAQDAEALGHAHLVAAENVKRFMETGTALNRVDPKDYLK